jgi:hypothetical protein
VRIATGHATILVARDCTTTARRRHVPQVCKLGQRRLPEKRVGDAGNDPIVGFDCCPLTLVEIGMPKVAKPEKGTRAMSTPGDNRSAWPRNSSRELRLCIKKIVPPAVQFQGRRRSIGALEVCPSP